MKNRKVTIEIAPSTYLWAAVIVAGIMLLVRLSDILFLFFAAILVTLAICPLVDRLEKRRIPRALSSFLILILVFGTFFGFTFSLAKPMFEQTQAFIEKLPYIIDTVSPVKFDVSDFTPQIGTVSGEVFRLAIDTLSGVIAILTIMVIAFYMTQEIHSLPKHLQYWFGDHKSRIYTNIIKSLEEHIGQWVRGEVILMAVVGVMSYIGYMIVGLPYAVALGVIAGFLELIPTIGPMIATIPAALVGFSISPTHGLAAIAVSIVVQQVENNFLVPKIMQSATGLSPIITILALMIAMSLGGPLFAVLSLPVVLAGKVIISHIRLNRENLPEID